LDLSDLEAITVAACVFDLSGGSVPPGVECEKCEQKRQIKQINADLRK
jgi:hypothetical protein